MDICSTYVHYIPTTYLFIQYPLKLKTSKQEQYIAIDMSSFAVQTVRQSATQSKLEINEKVSPQFESLPQMKE